MCGPRPTAKRSAGELNVRKIAFGRLPEPALQRTSPPPTNIAPLATEEEVLQAWHRSATPPAGPKARQDPDPEYARTSAETMVGTDGRPAGPCHSPHTSLTSHRAVPLSPHPEVQVPTQAHPSRPPLRKRRSTAAFDGLDAHHTPDEGHMPSQTSHPGSTPLGGVNGNLSQANAEGLSSKKVCSSSMERGG